MTEGTLDKLARTIRSSTGSSRVRLAATNTAWLFLDKFLRLVGGLVVGIWVTRYLGPERFGLLNYAVAFSSLFGVLASLGLDGIVIRDLVEHPDEAEKIMGTAFALKLAASIVCILGALGAILLVRPSDTSSFKLVGITAMSMLFQSVYVVDLYFRARTLGKYSVLAQGGAFVAATLFKLYLLLSKGTLQAIAATSLVESILAAGLLWVSYRRNAQESPWQVDLGWMRRLLKDSWPMIFSGILITVFMRVDQIMIGQMLGNKEVGIYSAAVRISEIWYIVPTTILSAIFPMILGIRKIDNDRYLARIQQLYTGALWCSILISIAMTAFGSMIIHLLYGNSYSGAEKILSIHVWTGVMVAIGSVWSQCILAENMQKLTIQVYVVTAIVNIVLNFLLIPKIGAVGAAWATLIGYVIGQQSAFLMYNARQTYKMLLGAMIMKVRH